MKRDLDALTRELAELAGEVDATGDWPAASMTVIDAHRCKRWAIPAEYGGDQLGPLEQIRGYEAIARGCMSTALIFTQHDAAVDVLISGENEGLKAELCPKIAASELQLTVGISQLTTSHQGGEPAMRVAWDDGEARFNGLMPWVTGAAHVDMIVTGGVLDDGRQLLACMPTDTPGLRIERPAKLAALDATVTSAVRCDDAIVRPSRVIRGPAVKALAIRSTVRPLVVSSTGVGLAGAMLDVVQELAPKRSAELRAFADDLAERYEEVRAALYDAADALSDPEAERPSSAFRASVNDLVIRSAVLAMTLAKGTGYLRRHPAQRLAREALFFLVWSAPEEVQVRTLVSLLG